MKVSHEISICCIDDTYHIQLMKNAWSRERNALFQNPWQRILLIAAKCGRHVSEWKSPLHCHGIRVGTILSGLSSTVGEFEWSRWQNIIQCSCSHTAQLDLVGKISLTGLVCRAWENAQQSGMPDWCHIFFPRFSRNVCDVNTWTLTHTLMLSYLTIIILLIFCRPEFRCLTV